MLRIGPEPIDPGALLNQFTRERGSRSGAVVSFSGVVRGENGVITALELEHYPGFTEKLANRHVDEATRRFGLEAALVAHRTGRIGVGEVVVFVATAAPHRRAAFEGADYLMDYLKTSAAFWKKEHGAGGSRWIEPRPEDHRDIERWAPKDNGG